MIDDIEIEKRIAELEKEVGYAIFPVRREHYKDKPDPSRMYLRFLQSIKHQKDHNTTAWQKMQNWD